MAASYTPTVDLKLFDFNEENKTLVAEISQLQLSCFPAVFYIKSHHTGRKVKFIRHHSDTDFEGEVQGIHYQPVEELANVTDVLIIND